MKFASTACERLITIAYSWVIKLEIAHLSPKSTGSTAFTSVTCHVNCLGQPVQSDLRQPTATRTSQCSSPPRVPLARAPVLPNRIQLRLKTPFRLILNQFREPLNLHSESNRLLCMQETIWRKSMIFDNIQYLFEPIPADKGEEYDLTELYNAVIREYPHLSRHRQDAIALEEVQQASARLSTFFSN